MLFRDLRPLENIFTLILYITEGLVYKKNHSHFWNNTTPTLTFISVKLVHFLTNNIQRLGRIDI